MIEFSPAQGFTTLAEFSSEVQRIVDTYCTMADSSTSEKKSRLDSEFDDLCRRYPELADQYLRALAGEYVEQNS
jgi:hypothetical protein